MNCTYVLETPGRKPKKRLLLEINLIFVNIRIIFLQSKLSYSITKGTYSLQMQWYLHEDSFDPLHSIFFYEAAGWRSQDIKIWSIVSKNSNHRSDDFNGSRKLYESKEHLPHNALSTTRHISVTRHVIRVHLNYQVFLQEG